LFYNNAVVFTHAGKADSVSIALWQDCYCFSWY